MGRQVTSGLPEASSRPAPLAARPGSLSMWGDVMGKRARIGLLLGATSCLVAVMVDWVIQELQAGPVERLVAAATSDFPETI